MEVVNPFILKNKARLITFLDDLSTVHADKLGNESILHTTTKIWVNPDPSRELAIIHSICELHLEELFALGLSRSPLRKLAILTEMLTKHKNQLAARLAQLTASKSKDTKENGSSIQNGNG